MLVQRCEAVGARLSVIAVHVRAISITEIG